MKHEREQLFSAIAPRYDLLNRVLSLGCDRTWRRRAVAAIGPRRIRRVLDLCCGTGDLGLEFLRRRDGGTVWFVDFSRPMLQMARRKIAQSIEARRGRALVCADTLRLPFADETFDAVMCAFGIRNMEHEAEALIEIRRVLRRRGPIAIVEFFRPTRLLSWFVYQTYGRVVIPLVGRLISGRRGAYGYLTQSVLTAMSRGEFEFLMETIGYRGLEGIDLAGGLASLVVGRKG